jgi:hypothetical protein
MNRWIVRPVEMYLAYWRKLPLSTSRKSFLCLSVFESVVLSFHFCTTCLCKHGGLWRDNLKTTHTQLGRQCPHFLHAVFHFHYKRSYTMSPTIWCSQFITQDEKFYLNLWRKEPWHTPHIRSILCTDRDPSRRKLRKVNVANVIVGIFLRSSISLRTTCSGCSLRDHDVTMTVLYNYGGMLRSRVVFEQR